MSVGVAPAGSLSHDDALRLAAAGTKTVRLTASWRKIEGVPGTYDFSSFDPQFQAVASAGMEVLPVLIEAPGWATEPGAVVYPDGRASAHYPVKPENRRAYVAFIRAFVARYGRGGSFVTANNLPPVTAYQVWSEPNVDVFARFPDAKKGGPLYAKLLNAAARGIRAVDPGATIVTAGMGDRARQSAFDLFLPAMLENKRVLDSFDVMAIQPFQVGAPVTAKLTIDKINEYVPVIRREISTKLPIWITEVAASTDGEPESIHLSDEPGQAKILRKVGRYVQTHEKSQRLKRLYWYGFRDISPGNLPEDTKTWNDYTGLFDFAGHPKPAWFQYARLAGGDPGSGPLP